MVLLLVGGGQHGGGQHCVAFEVHKQVLNDESHYFHELFATNPGLTRHSLPDINPVTFKMVHKWLYGNRKSIVQFIVLSRLNCEEAGIESMLNLYFIAYHLRFTPLEDLAMDLLGNGYYRSDMRPSVEDIELAYAKTESGSPLRRYMVRQFQQQILTSTSGPPAGELHDLLTRLPPSFAMDFVLQSRGVLTNGLWQVEVLPVCEFHSHHRGDPCPTGRLSFNCIDHAYATGSCELPEM
jgi:hypothetical protein